MGNIVNALSKFGNAFSGLGSTLMVPIIIMVVAMVFRVEWKKALKSGLLVGAGFQGISLVTGLLGQSLSPCAKILFEKFSIDLRYVDAGWAAAAGIAYSTEIGGHHHSRDHRVQRFDADAEIDQNGEYRYLELLALCIYRFPGVRGDGGI